ncbi:hypothetical protein AMTRI_Chr02g257670 [Amborella trichopoda]
MVDQNLDRLESELGSLKADQERSFKEVMESMQQMLVAINTRLDQWKNSRNNDESSNSQLPPMYTRQTLTGSLQNGSMGSIGTYLPRMVKLDFPKFNGEEDPTSWVCGADQFFEFHQTPEEDHIPLYQLTKEEGRIATWEDFKSGFHVPYSPTQFQYFFGDLIKLQQTGLVRDSQTKCSCSILYKSHLLTFKVLTFIIICL